MAVKLPSPCTWCQGGFSLPAWCVHACARGNVLHLPFVGHPNTWQVHVGAVVHVGIWIRCFQTLCIPLLPTLSRQEELLAGIAPISPWIPFQTGRAGVPVCCSYVPWPGWACWDPPCFRGTWSGSSWWAVKHGCLTGWNDGDALTWSLLSSLLPAGEGVVLVAPGDWE